MPKNKEGDAVAKSLQSGSSSRYMTERASTSKQFLEKKKSDVRYSKRQASYSQVLLQEEAGYLELEEGEDLSDVTQQTIKKAVDITSATKCFDLSLGKFGPYRTSYTRNGRHLAIGGRAGHLASFDWITKRLDCEINVMEEIVDLTWLHQETMLAVAQKDWVYIYDNQGVELHCIKQLHRILRMEFLPYHFLLVGSNERGYLTWLDVSIGKLVAQRPTHLGRLDVMCQNPYNAVVVLGHSKGTVSMWSPMVKEPLVSILCHPQPIRGVAVDVSGRHMATVSTDRSLKIWDIRNFGSCLHSYRIPGCASQLDFSQRGLLAVGMGSMVQVFQDPCRNSVSKPYLSHSVRRTVTDLSFCPYEDVLGIGHDGGFSSILVPGAGEPNFDALEVNPYQTKSQRQEAEVKALLEKIQPEMIVLDPSELNLMDTGDRKAKTQVTTSTRIKSRLSELKDKSKIKSSKKLKRKVIMKGMEARKIHKSMVEKKTASRRVRESDAAATDVLNRFKPKTS